MALDTIARQQEELVTAAPTDTAEDLAKLMEAGKVGCVVVTEGETPIGIVTDRDLALSICGANRTPADVRAKDLMSADLVTVDVEDGVFEVCQRMSEHEVRRMPVTDGDELVGILTLDDLVMLLENEMQDISQVIRAEAPPMEM